MSLYTQFQNTSLNRRVSMILFRHLILLSFTACVVFGGEALPRFPSLPELPVPHVDDAVSADDYLTRGRAAFKRGDFSGADSSFMCARIAAVKPGMSRKVLADVVFWLGKTRVKLARFAEAERLCREAVELWKAETGEKSPETLRALCSLAGCYRVGGWYDEADKLYTQILNDRKDAPVDLDIAAVRNDFGDNYRNLARYSEAEENLKQALEIRTKLAGPDDAATAESTVDLGKLYWQMGQLQRAGALLEKGFKLQEKALGPEHPDLIETLDYWGDVFAHLLDYRQAEVYLDRARLLCEKTLGKDHARYSDLLNDLAIVYNNTKRKEKAEFAYLESLRITELTYGKEHYYYALGLYNMGKCYLSLKKFNEAENAFLRSLEVIRTAFGKNHIYEAIPLRGLISLYERTSRFDDVEDTFKRVRALKEKHDGAASVEVAEILEDAASFEIRRGNTEKAEALCARAQEIMGSEKRADPHVRSEALLRLAYVCAGLNRFQDAAKCASESLKLKLDSGQKGDTLTKAYCALSFFYLKSGNPDEAEKQLQIARRNDPESVEFAKVALFIARKWMDDENWARAEGVMKITVRDLRKNNANNASKENLGTALMTLGICQMWLEKYEDAATTFNEIAADFKTFGMEISEQQIGVLKWLQSALDKLGKTRESDAVRKRMKDLEPQDPKLEF